ncbi:MAG: hypothetical protein IPK69_10180 [Phycisphaerales bacterium]|nr:MAG: hypothetical protein IPK69_10180 [Phycisphaerales bacterium]
MTADHNPNQVPAPSSSTSSSIPEDTLKQALHAFKKRLKLTRLDAESKLGANKPMTSGRKSEGMGIIPPNQFPREVYQELARQGKIKDQGGGFYTM